MHALSYTMQKQGGGCPQWLKDLLEHKTFRPETKENKKAE